MRHQNSQTKRDFEERQIKFRENGSAKKNVVIRNTEALPPCFNMLNLNILKYMTTTVDSIFSNFDADMK